MFTSLCCGAFGTAKLTLKAISNKGITVYPDGHDSFLKVSHFNNSLLFIEIILP